MSRSELSGLGGSRWDAAVIGAGPAGTMAAHRLAQAGRSVLLVDKGSFPRPKVCGGCLNGRAMSILELAGLDGVVRDLGGESLHRFSVHSNNRRIDIGLPRGIAVSRPVLDAALAQSAESRGVHFLDGTRAALESPGENGWALSLRRGPETVSVTAAYILAAGGLGSKPAASIDTTVKPRARLGAGALFHTNELQIEPGVIQMAVSIHGYVGLVRVENSQVNAAAAFDRDVVRDHGSPAAAAEYILATSRVPVPSGLAEAEWRGTPPLMQAPSDVARDRLLLIGDAAGYVEPFTGEGMAWAFESGIAAAAIVTEYAESPATVAKRWRAGHRRLLRRSQRRCRMVALGLRHPTLVAVALSALQRRPELARPIVRRLNEPVTTHRST